MLGTPPYRLSRMVSVKEYCQIRRNQNRVKLEQFLYWIHSSGCRRAGMMKYFEENQKVENSVCCDHCGETVESIISYLPVEPDVKEHASYSDWKQILASLLLP